MVRRWEEGENLGEGEQSIRQNLQDEKVNQTNLWLAYTYDAKV